MMKKLLVSALFLSYVTMVSAQTIPSERVVLSIAPNATDVSFAVRTDANAPLVCNFGANEAVKTYTAATDGNLTMVEYTFAHPSASERTIEVAADKLVTLRIVQKKQVNGVLEVKSDALKNLNVDYVDLLKHNKVDVAQCPNLEVLTLTFTGVEEIVLPKSDMMKSVQASPTLLGQGSLKKVNNWDAPNLSQIGFVGASIDTLDVRSNTRLTSLVCSLPAKNKGLRGIKGAKMLKELTMLDVRGNALAFDQIPDRYVLDAPLEDFRYSSQGSYLVPKSKVSGLTVDLSDLFLSRGISTARERTEFVWKYKASETASYQNVPAALMTSESGKFTFDASLSEDNIVRVYCTMTNGGYPGIGVKGKNTISTYMIKLEKNPTGISTVKDNASIFGVSATETGCRIDTSTPQRATVYSFDGKTVWTGQVPATVELERGVYVVRSESGDYVKVKR